MLTENWKEEGLPIVTTDKSITVTLPDLRTITLDSYDKRFNKLKVAIKESNWELVPEIIDNKLAIQKQSDGRFVVGEDDYVYIENKKLPQSLSNRLIGLLENDFSVDNLINFWDNLKENPSFRSVKELHGFLEANDLPITPDGCFIAFRKVRDDFLDNHTGTMDNSPGQTLEMDRNEVDDDPSNSCSHGLHVANLKYAKTFSGTRLIMVKVHPADVVTVPDDYENEKMRVCKFYVVSEVDENGAKAVHKVPLFDDGSSKAEQPDILVEDNRNVVGGISNHCFSNDDEDDDKDYDDYDDDDDYYESSYDDEDYEEY